MDPPEVSIRARYFDYYRGLSVPKRNRLYLDENVNGEPKRNPLFLKALEEHGGFDITTTSTEDRDGLHDEEVLAYAARERRLLLTADKAFWKRLKIQLDHHCGVVILRNVAARKKIIEDLDELEHELWAASPRSPPEPDHGERKPEQKPKKRQRSKAEISELEEHVLTHIAVYRVTLKLVLRRLYDLGEHRVNDLIISLSKDSRIIGEKLFDSSFRYYRLSTREANRRRPNTGAGRPRGSQALPTDLQTLWFCCMGEPLRSLVAPHVYGGPLPDEIEAASPGRTIHCVDHDQHKRLWQLVYTSSAATARKRALETIADLIKHTRDKDIRVLIEAEKYGLAVLVDSSIESCDDLEKDIEKAGYRKTFPLIQVFQAPGSEMILDALTSWKQTAR